MAHVSAGFVFKTEEDMGYGFSIGVNNKSLSAENYAVFNSTPLTKQGSWFQAFPGKYVFFFFYQSEVLDMA